MASKAQTTKKPEKAEKKVVAAAAKPAAKPPLKPAAKPAAKPNAKAEAKPAPKPKAAGPIANPLSALKTAYRNWHESKGGNAAEFIGMLAEDATWGSIANGTMGVEFARELLSRANVQTYFDIFTRDWEVVFCRVERVLAEGNSFVVITETSWRHKRTGKSFITPKIDIWDFRRGRVVNFFEYFDTASAVRNAL